MLHPDCTGGKRLLDSYLMALSIEDSAKRFQGLITAREEKNAKDYLASARQRYWTHVEHHRCRKEALMDRDTLSAALRVLKGCYYGDRASQADIELVKRNALADDLDLSLDDLARNVSERALRRQTEPEL